MKQEVFLRKAVRITVSPSSLGAMGLVVIKACPLISRTAHATKRPVICNVCGGPIGVGGGQRMRLQLVTWCNWRLVGPTD